MINTSSNITKLGSETCPPVIHKKYGCGSPDFLITALELDHETGVLTIYQNPNNCKSITIAELLQIQEIRNELSKVINGKVDKTYFLHTDKGIQGGGTFESELTLTIKPKDAHIDTTSEGLSIKRFTEVNTSGTVPSPEDSKKTEEYFLNAKGEWSKLGVLQFKGVIETSTTLTNLDTGDMYIIKDLGDPTKTVTVNGQTFLSTDVIVWDGTKFVDIGQVSVRVNLTLSKGTENNVINNSAGSGITLTPATTAVAGLMSSTDKTNLETVYSRELITSIQNPTAGSTTVIFNYTSVTGGNSSQSKSVSIPAATISAAGVMTKDDKAKLEELNNRVVITGITGSASGNNYIITPTKSDGTKPPITVPLVEGNGNAGLMSGTDKVKLDELNSPDSQPNWLETNTNLHGFIKNKPNILGTSSSTNGFLVPASSGQSGEKYLKWDGTWGTVKSSPDIYVQSNEPTGSNITDGTIWIQT